MCNPENFILDPNFYLIFHTKSIHQCCTKTFSLISRFNHKTSLSPSTHESINSSQRLYSVKPQKKLSCLSSSSSREKQAEVQRVLNGIWKIICKAICIVCAFSSSNGNVVGRDAHKKKTQQQERRNERRKEEEWQDASRTKWPERNEIKGRFFMVSDYFCLLSNHPRVYVSLLLKNFFIVCSSVGFFFSLSLSAR